jgi:predicted metal-dependent HD superfamily phosphohydrolase
MENPIKIQNSSLYGTFRDLQFDFRDLQFDYIPPVIDYIPHAIKLINGYGVDITEIEVRVRWSEPHRYFHTTEHLNDVLGQIFDYYNSSNDDLPIMVVAAVFHDIIYDPKRTDNEEKSAELLMSYLKIGMSLWLSNNIEKVKKLILATKTHDKIHELISNFNKFDCSILDSGFSDLLKWEEQIYKEYEFAGCSYKDERIKFLESCIPDHMENLENLNRLIKYIRNGT